jgi:hypothetical protein
MASNLNANSLNSVKLRPKLSFDFWRELGDKVTPSPSALDDDDYDCGSYEAVCVPNEGGKAQCKNKDTTDGVQNTICIACPTDPSKWKCGGPAPAPTPAPTPSPGPTPCPPAPKKVYKYRSSIDNALSVRFIANDSLPYLGNSYHEKTLYSSDVSAYYEKCQQSKWLGYVPSILKPEIDYLTNNTTKITNIGTSSTPPQLLKGTAIPKTANPPDGFPDYDPNKSYPPKSQVFFRNKKYKRTASNTPGCTDCAGDSNTPAGTQPGTPVDNSTLWWTEVSVAQTQIEFLNTLQIGDGIAVNSNPVTQTEANALNGGFYGPKFDSARYNIKSNIPFNDIDETIGDFRFSFNVGQGTEVVESSDVLKKYNFLCNDPIFNSNYTYSNGKASFKFNNSNVKCREGGKYFTSLSLMNILTTNRNFQLDFKNVFDVDSEIRSCISLFTKLNESVYHRNFSTYAQDEYQIKTKDKCEIIKATEPAVPGEAPYSILINSHGALTENYINFVNHRIIQINNQITFVPSYPLYNANGDYTFLKPTKLIWKIFSIAGILNYENNLSYLLEYNKPQDPNPDRPAHQKIRKFLSPFSLTISFVLLINKIHFLKIFNDIKMTTKIADDFVNVTFDVYDENNPSSGNTPSGAPGSGTTGGFVGGAQEIIGSDETQETANIGGDF